MSSQSAMFAGIEDVMNSLSQAAPDAAAAQMGGDSKAALRRPFECERTFTAGPMKNKHGTVTIEVSLRYHIE